MANNPLILKSLDFQSVKNELIAYLSSKDEFKDYDFSASNLNYIVDALSYVTNYNGYLAHATYNELLIDTVQLRRDIISIAKLLNYIPYRTTSASGLVTLSVTDWSKVYLKDPGFDKLVDTIVIPKNTIFNGDSQTSWITSQDYVLSNANNFTINVKVYEGVWNTGVSLGTSNGASNQKFRLNVPSLSDSFVTVYVNGVPWENKQDITEYQSTSEYYQIFENFLEIYDFQFGDGTLGMIPAQNATITVDYLESSGTTGNDKGNLKLIGSAYINGNIGGAYEVDNTAFSNTTIAKGSGGRVKEDIESIRRNAPMYYASQQRCITSSDYLAILRTHPYVEYTRVYGGEELNPPKYGFVVATIKPPNADVLTSEQKDAITAFLEPYHIKGLRFTTKDPVYINFEIEVILNYYLKYYTVTQVTGSAMNAALSYFDTILSENEGYRYSRLLEDFNEIDGVQSTRLYQKIYLDITTSVDGVYYYDLGQKIKAGTIDLTFESSKGFYDSGGLLLNRETNAEIGTVNYEKGILSISDYTAITSGSEKIYFEMDIEDVDLYQNILFKYQPVSSSFTGVGV